MKILVVDDEALIRRSLARSLMARGYQVYEADNGIQALEILASGQVDAMVLDMMMPEKTGYDVLKEFDGQIPIVIISAFTGEDLNSKSFQNDIRVKSVIKKPFADLFLVTDEIVGFLK